MRSSRVSQLRARRCGAVLVTGAFAVAVGLVATVAGAAAGDLGYMGQSYAGVSSGTVSANGYAEPSGPKPESKLWFNDGFWWASMFDSGAGSFQIFRLSTATQTWTDTNVVIDSRPTTRQDVLWGGTKLYVASHVFAETQEAGNPSYLYRFSYNAATDTHTLDPGFPVAINDVSTETLAIAKDSRGKLWATWTQGNQVYVSHTTTSDATWGAPFVIPVAASATTVGADDISSIIAFGSKIGVLWSNAALAPPVFHFAVHPDGQGDSTWTLQTPLSGSSLVDDHINLKADSAGRVLAAIKTNKSSATSPLIKLLVRSTGGTWSNYDVAYVADSWTRPIVVLDEEHGTVHVFGTCPHPPRTSGQSGGDICEKSSPLSSIAFQSGYGAPVIRDVGSAATNDVTSTKQNLSSSTGRVIVAGNGYHKRYWHAYDPLAAAPLAPANTAPPSISGTAAEGNTLSVVPGSYTGTPAPVLSYQWQSCNAVCADIAGAIGTTYTVSSSDVGHTVRVVETATNSANHVSAASDPTAVVTGGGTPLSGLLPNGDGSRDAAIKNQAAGTTNLYAAIDEGIAGADTTTYVRNNQNTSGSYFARLTDMPADFASMTLLRISIRVRTTSRVDDDTTLFARLFASNETTPLSDEIALGTNPGTAGWTTLSNIAFTGVVAGDKATWDGARLRLRWAFSQVGTADGSQLRVTALTLDGGYGAAAPSAAPVANFNGSPTSGSAPLMVSFTDQSTNTPTSWAWDFDNDGSVDSSAQNPSHTYASAGTYTVKLTATNSLGSDAEVKAGYVTVSAGSTTLNLLPNGDGSHDATIKNQAGATSNLFSSIDEGIASADNGTTYVKNAQNSNGTYFVELTDMPAGFAAVSSLSIDIRVRTVNRVDDNTTLYAQLFAADEATPLSDEVEVAVNPGAAAWSTVANVAFTGLVAGSKATWDGARLRLRWAFSQVGTADGSQIRLSTVELHGTYTT